MTIQDVPSDLFKTNKHEGDCFVNSLFFILLVHYIAGFRQCIENNCPFQPLI